MVCKYFRSKIYIFSREKIAERERKWRTYKWNSGIEITHCQGQSGLNSETICVTMVCNFGCPTNALNSGLVKLVLILGWSYI